MKILRTIETFLPYVCGPANQAFQISRGLEARHISSPVLTTYCDVEEKLPAKETINSVNVFRYKNQVKLMRYCVSLGMVKAFNKFDIVHSHNYRNFQTDMSFFFRKLGKNLSSLVPTDPFSDSKDICLTGNPSFLTGFMIFCH